MLRLGNFEPRLLPDVKLLEERAIKRFEVFPHALDHEWVWEALDDAPEGRIAVARAADGQWHFTPATREGSGALLESMRSIPPVYEEATGRAFLDAMQPLRETSAIAWAITLSLVLLAIIATLAIHRLVLHLAVVADRRGRGTLGVFLRSISLPLAVLVGLVCAALGLAFVSFPAVLDSLRWQLLRGLAVIVGVITLFKLVDFGAWGLQQTVSSRGSPYNATAVALLRQTVRSVAFVLLTLFLLQNLFGFRIGSLLAGLGVIGLGISLAAQGVLKNALGAFNIFINKPFLLGDWIQFDRSLGAVEDVGLYATKVRLLSGELLTVPNMRFIDEEVENLSERQYLRREMNVAIPYDTPRPRIEKALRLLGEVLGREEISEAGHFQRAPEISFSHYGDYFLNLRVYYWYYIGRGPGVQRDAQRGWFTYLQHSTAVNLGIKEAFDEAGIEFAFPSETHFLTDDPARGLVVGDRAGTQEREGEGAE